MSSLREAAIDAVGEIDQLVSVSKSADVIVRIALEHAARVVAGMFIATPHALIFRPFDGPGLKDSLAQQPGSTSFETTTHAQTLDRIVAAALSRAEEEQP